MIDDSFQGLFLLLPSYLNSLRGEYGVFDGSTILTHISLNLHIIIGLLKLEIFEILKVIYGLFPGISRY